MSRLPSLTALRCFDASARHGSITRAAADLHLTQGAVSHQILGLEQQLGVPLFERRRHGLELTDAGRTYWSEVGRALRQLERATQDLVAGKGQGGSLDLSVASTFATHWLMARLPTFVAANPQVTLNLSTRIGPVDFRAAGAPDAAIEYCTGAEDGVLATPIMPLVLRPFACRAAAGARKRGLPKAQLAALLRQQPLVRHSTVPEAWPGWLARAGLQDAVGAAHLEAGPRYDLLSMALNGVIAGLGIALLPDFVARDAVQAGRIVRLSEVGWTSPRAYHLRYPAAKAGFPAVRRFEAWLGGLADQRVDSDRSS